MGERYRTVFAQSVDGGIAVYKSGRGNMPQILTVDVKQAGISHQGRTIFRYRFDDQALCYRPYVSGRIESSEPYVGQQVPKDFPEGTGEGPKPARCR